ncbi:predicted protein [Arabidopsis lyrata subsp. lyrata]|uniref:Predicted protein n=1 Tax=Arabidopsis lyrata subsp. lyrata TaxID=81972 RepID=D7L0G3_ARALL|nr:predicted protein [Arabidopsis lyrata subsp. lyrata]
MDRRPSFPHYQIPNPNLFHHVPPPNPNPNFFVRPPLAHLQNPNNYSIAVSAADLRALRYNLFFTIPVVGISFDKSSLINTLPFSRRTKMAILIKIT